VSAEFEPDMIGQVVTITRTYNLPDFSFLAREQKSTVSRKSVGKLASFEITEGSEPGSVTEVSWTFSGGGSGRSISGELESIEKAVFA